jgi:hypothetical protein
VLCLEVCASTFHACLYIYRTTSSVSLKVVATLCIPSQSHVLQSLLGGDLAIVLDVDVLVGGQSVDLVFGERGTITAIVSSSQHSVIRTDNIREALDELELVLDLAALVGALLLGAVVC